MANVPTESRGEREDSPATRVPALRADLGWKSTLRPAPLDVGRRPPLSLLVEAGGRIQRGGARGRARGRRGGSGKVRRGSEANGGGISGGKHRSREANRRGWGGLGLD
jgi:hypothetical protein